MFVGVSWHKDQRKWRAIIKHGEKQHRLGCFDDDEREAARAFDLAARQLQADAAHSEKVGTKRLRLNFPTEEEVKRAKEKGMLQTDEDRAAAAAASERQWPSSFVGVSWDKCSRKWTANIRHNNRKRKHISLFDDPQEAANAVDTAAQQLRGEDAHGGRSWTDNLHRLNFPSEQEAARAKALGVPTLRYSTLV